MIDNNDILQLSNDHSIEVDSHAFYKHPIQFKNSSSNKVMSFSTMFAFDLINEHGNQGRHQFAFTIFPSGALPGPYLGELNSKNNGNISDHVFMVAFTVTHPKFSDIDDNHVVVGLIQESTDAATRVHHQCLTRGVVGNVATRISVLFFWDSCWFVLNQTDLGWIDSYRLAEIDWFMLYRSVQANIGRFRLIPALNQAKIQVRIIIYIYIYKKKKKP